MASAASRNNIDLSSRCQVTHASGVAVFGCGPSTPSPLTPRLPALEALMYGFLTDSSPHLWKRCASPGAKVTPVLLLSQVAGSQVYRGPGKAARDYCGNVNCTQAQSAACLCVHWFWVRKIVGWTATLWCPCVLQQYAVQISIDFLSPCLSLSLHVSWSHSCAIFY